jgi:hypothetical protein
MRMQIFSEGKPELKSLVTVQGLRSPEAVTLEHSGPKFTKRNINLLSS